MLALFRVLSVREIGRHPGRSALIASSIALGVIALTTTWALSRALDRALRDTSTPTALAELHVSNGDSGVARELVETVAGVEGVRSARPVVVERIRVTGRRSASAVLLGVDLPAYRDQVGAGLKIPPEAAAGFLKATISRQTPMLIGASLRDQVDPEGDRVTAWIAGKKRPLRAIGTLDPGGALGSLGGSVVVMRDREAAELAGHPGRISRVDVAIVPQADPTAVRDRIARAIGGAGEVITADAQDDRVQESLGALRVGFALCGLGAMGLALFLVANVLGVSVAERRRTIGLIRSLGGTRGQVRGEVLGEALILGAIGSAVGLPIGFGVARLALGPLLSAVGDVFVPLESRGIDLDPVIAAASVAAGLATSLLAAWSPASRASAMAPTQAMARSAGPEDATATRKRAVSASLLILAALASFLSGRALPGTARIYLVLGLGLLATIVVIPLITSSLARLLRPAAGWVAGIPGRLAIDSLIRSPSRTGSTIAGLAGGVALMIQTGGVIQGNESAVRSWVEDCVTGDLFVTAGGPMSASGRTIPMEGSIASRIAETVPGAKVVPMRFRHLDFTRDGGTARILLLALDAASYVDMSGDRSPPLLDRPLYRLLLEPGTALVSENFASLNGVRIGSTIALPGEDGPVALKVVGTVVDFSNSRGTILVDRQGVGKAFGTSAVDVFSVGLGGKGNAAAACRAINRSAWAAEDAAQAMTSDSLRAHILGMIGRLYGVAYVQEIVAAAVAALGVSASMLICVAQRRRELGLLRALGATSRQVFITVIAEAAAMAIIGAALGAALGFLLEWYVLRVILLAETGFNFPVLLPWADALLVSAVIGAAAVASGLAPAWSASRMGIGPGLARE